MRITRRKNTQGVLVMTVIALSFALAVAHPHSGNHLSYSASNVPPVVTWDEMSVWNGGMAVSLVFAGIPEDNSVRFCLRWRDAIPISMIRTSNFSITTTSGAQDRFCGKTDRGSNHLAFIADLDGEVPARPERIRIAGVLANLIFIPHNNSDSSTPEPTMFSTPTVEPIVSPTSVPIATPTTAPTVEPTTKPKLAPSAIPSREPTASPATAGSDGPFRIVINYDEFNPLTAPQRRVFDKAAARWEKVITRQYSKRSFPGHDIEILASAHDIDGEYNILGQAGPTGLNRNAGFLPDQAMMDFDSADLSRMEGNDLLQSVIEHEMGHCLGFGTLWEIQGLIAGEGTSEPSFRGEMAIQEYKNLTGKSGNVPVENSGGWATRDSHWREDTFQHELMTGFLTGDHHPLSRLTIASFGDLGYEVDMGAGDQFSDPRDQRPSVQDQNLGGFYCKACQMKHTSITVVTTIYPLSSPTAKQRAANPTGKRKSENNFQKH